VFAVVAVAATSASAAEPEWGRCLAHKKGEYTEGNCKTKSAKAHKGKFEWFPGGGAACYPLKHGEYTNSSCTSKSGKPHKGKYEKTAGGKFTGAGGAGVLHALIADGCADQGGCIEADGELTEGGKQARQEEAEGLKEPFNISVECTSEHATGEATGTNGIANVSVTFNGCRVGSIPCSNTANAEEIVTNVLKGELGYISKASHEVGARLEPAQAKGLFAEFTCGPLVSEVGTPQAKEGPVAARYEPSGGGDAIISPITPVNQMTPSFTQVYSGNENDENLPSKFEGGPFSELETALYGVENNEVKRTYYMPSDEEITNVNTPEGPSEIRG
jgi:hypothetical protein